MFPNCSIPYIQSMKTKFSPANSENPVILGYLNNFGALILFSKGKDWEELVNISELRASALNLFGEPCKTYKDLERSVNMIVFQDFEWCKKIFGGNTRYLVTNVKDGALLFYSIKCRGKSSQSFENSTIQDLSNLNLLDPTELNLQNSGKPLVELKYSEKLENLKNCSFRWITTPQNLHFLIVSTENGGLTMFSLSIDSDGKFGALTKEFTVDGQLNIPISHMTYQICEKGILVLCAKTHSVEVYFFDLKGRYLSGLVKYIGISITGIQQFQDMTYIFSTLDSQFYALEFFVKERTLYAGEKFKIETGILSDRYACHGLLASRNRAIFYFALYPQQNFDHLVLRQPFSLNLQTISSVDPFQMLVENKMNQLTNYYDCVEVVRFLGARDEKILGTLENLPFSIDLTTKFLYYLKLQLIVQNAKVTFFKRRSNILHEKHVRIFKIFSLIIEVIKCYIEFKYIKKFYFKEKVPVDEMILKSSRNIRNFLNLFLKEDFDQEYKVFQVSLRPELQKIINETSFLGNVVPENCQYCQEVIEKDQLVCKNDHKIARCCITKLQLPFFPTNICKFCHRATVPNEILRKITMNNILLMMCPTCDLVF